MSRPQQPLQLQGLSFSYRRRDGSPIYGILDRTGTVEDSWAYSTREHLT